MASIASKNLFDLLGNDPEAEPEQPTKAIDKPVARTGKRVGAGSEAPKSDASRARTGNRGAQTGSEGAFRDRQAGSSNNRAKDDGAGRSYGDRDRPRGSDENRGRGRGRGSGYRGGRGGGGRDDRHSRTGVTDHAKQVAHGWGGNTGEGEWADEKAGDAIAKDEEKQDSNAAAPADGDAQKEAQEEEEPEPEDKSKSYDEYLAEQAEKKLQLSSTLEARKPNEGTKKKFPEGKEVVAEEEDFIAGSGGKAKRERERKQKATVSLDDAKLYQREAPRDGYRGGRGGRGGSRGGESSYRGEGRGRGRGGRGDGEYRGRGGRGGRGGSSNLNLNDSNAFPTLGGS